MTRILDISMPELLKKWESGQIPKDAKISVVFSENSENGEKTHDSVLAKIREWQVRDGSPLLEEIPTHVLAQQWAEEDAKMTPEEKRVAHLLWLDIEKSLAENTR
jgi:hypothetical protein